MLQKGLEDQLQTIQDQLQKAKERVNTQTLLFSATFPHSLRAKCKTWLEKENKVIDCLLENNKKDTSKDADANGDANGDDNKATATATASTLVPTVSQNIRQIVHVCAEHKKGKKLMKYLDGVREAAREEGLRHVPKVLVFVNTIKKARYLHGFLRKNEHNVQQIHGKRNQKERTEAIQDFKSGKVNTLVATDIAGRGIHIPGLKHVVLYDFPPTIEQYVHRVGRTGRQEDSGEAFAFFTRNLAPLAPSLVGLLREHKQEVDPHLVVVAEAAIKAAEKRRKEEELRAQSVGEQEEEGEEGGAEGEGDGDAGDQTASTANEEENAKKKKKKKKKKKTWC